MKKICLVIPSLQAGGMERVITELGNYFSNNEVLKVVIIQYGNSTSFYPISSKIIHEIIPYKRDKSSKIVFTIKSISFLRNKIKKYKPDAILSFGETYNSFVLFSLIGLRSKIFISDRSQPDKDWGIFHNLMRKFLYKRATGIIAQTSIAKKIIFKITKHKNIIVIGNPIRNYSSKTSKKDNYVLTVSRLIKSKNIDHIIDIFKCAETKGWKLLIIGDGPENLNLKKYCNEIGLEERVKFLGMVENVEKYYQKSKIFLFASKSEGFPNALAEAMSFSLPCISYDCIAGPSDLIENGVNGYLVSMNNKPEYIDYFNLLLSDEKLRVRIGKSAKKKISNFDRELIAKKYLKFILNEY